MKQVLVNLLKLKSILSLLFCGTTCYLAIKGVLEVETFMVLTSAIITYYFNKKDGE